MAKKQPNKQYMADFETTVLENDCRVWLWGIVEIGQYDTFEWGTDIQSFFDALNSGRYYFHNLKFDGIFLLDYLLKNDFEYTDERLPYVNEFTTLISRMGQYYSITLNIDGKRIEFYDSLKKLPMPVERIAKSFNLPELKGELDYLKQRKIGYEPTPDEIEYLRKDLEIPARALDLTFKTGGNLMTIGADALREFRQIISAKQFSRLFPTLSIDIDSEIRKAYRGGFTYADPRYSKRVVGSGLVFDVNSLYPHIMYSSPMPYGDPKFNEGEPLINDDHDLWIASITFMATLKKNRIPCIQIKKSSYYVDTEYVREVNEPITLYVTNVDWELYNDQYNITVISYNGYWSFKSFTGIFNTYIDKWTAVKETSTGGVREIAKLHLNSLYGKFATNPDVTGKYPVLEDDAVKLKLGPQAERDPVYTPVGVFITSWARAYTIRAAQKHYKYFAYADTDSLHLMCSIDEVDLPIHDTERGKWCLELEFKNAFYARSKCYTELDYGDEYHTHIAGLPRQIADKLTFSDFKSGRIIEGKLQPKTVPGGVILAETTYTMKF